jgi:2-amino-4-hydroxy-6-hydroxymethyldihydropteridine diphosphokinase
MVVVFATVADADDIERVLTDIEYAGGRLPRQPRFSSRALDLDLLLYGAMVDARRRVPRDDIMRYPFVLAPLAELASAVPHPLTGRELGAEWARMQGSELSLRRVGSLAALSRH